MRQRPYHRGDRSDRPRLDPRARFLTILVAFAVAYGASLLREREQAGAPPPPVRDAPLTQPEPARRRASEQRRSPSPPASSLPTVPGPPMRPPRDWGGAAPVGSFNIKWFGTNGPERRDEDDVRHVAEVVRATDAALLGLQEIGDEAMMDRLIAHLPGYRYVLGTSGRGQRCGVLWDTARASVGRPAEWPDINQGMERAEGDLRAPLVAPARVGDFDFLFVVVHLKAMFDERSVRMRRTQTDRLRARLDDWVRRNADKDVIVVGDFNDFVGSPALGELTARRRGGVGFVNAGARLPESAITHMDPNSRIDHVLLSSPAVSQEEWTGRAFVYPKPAGAERRSYEDSVSDHLPTWATFRADRDNDP